MSAPMTALGAMRERITLMREEKSEGAGGRMQLVTPIIADVWAEVEESPGSLNVIAGRQRMAARMSFRTHAGEGYADSRRIAFDGRSFRVEGSRSYGTGRCFIEFTASEILN